MNACHFADCYGQPEKTANFEIQPNETTGYAVGDHFRGVTKMIEIGKGGQHLVNDYMLTREHEENNESVHDMLGQRGIKPEQLPAEGDIKNLERRGKAEEKEARPTVRDTAGAEGISRPLPH